MKVVLIAGDHSCPVICAGERLHVLESSWSWVNTHTRIHITCPLSVFLYCMCIYICVYIFIFNMYVWKFFVIVFFHCNTCRKHAIHWLCVCEGGREEGRGQAKTVKLLRAASQLTKTLSPWWTWSPGITYTHTWIWLWESCEKVFGRFLYWGIFV